MAALLRVAAVALLLLGCIAIAVGLSQAADDSAAKNSAEAAAFMKKSLVPFMEKHCFECHFGEDAEAGLALDSYANPAAIVADRRSWKNVLRMIRGGEMPPEGQPRPPVAEIEPIAQWIEKTINRVDCSGPIDPGRVTIRRLNRAEYTNTIRDLLAVEFDATADFPADEVGYGFDNIGDVLSVPPILMEKYLDAAEQIASQAIVASSTGAAKRKRYPAGQLQGPGSDRGGVRVLSTSGELAVQHRFDAEGKYLIRTKAYGQQAGDEPARMELRIDGKTQTTFDVKATAADPADYEHRLELGPGQRRVAAAFVNDFYDPDASAPNDRDRNLAVMEMEIVGPLDVKPEDYPESHRRIFFVRPGNDLSEDDAARQILRRLATRAYRRPVDDAEIERLMRLVKLARGEGENFEASIRLALEAILVSPRFLFRLEQDPVPNTRQTVCELDDFELAARLSYFLFSSMPDEELFEEARRGSLRENLDVQVRRMLADPKAHALVDNFAGQWLELRNLDMATPDRKQFATFDDSLRQSMRTEAEMFFENILREDRSILELVNADYTFVDQRLAEHYGIEGVQGDQFRRVSLDGTPRGGVITQAAVLTVTSNPTRTSPVKRGKWILENILGTPPPPPPPNVPMLAEDAKAQLSGSLRERMEQHRANPNCAVCHRKMDALGFALENYDAVGAWRTKDGPFDIDPAGVLPDGQEISGPQQMKQVLLAGGRNEFVRCLSEKMLTYALGRGLEYYDKCAVDRIARSLAENEYRFSALILAVVHSEPFQKRRGKDDDDPS